MDFGDRLTFSYESRTAATDTTAEEIEKQLYTDGRLANKALRELCELREKRSLKRFLSCSLRDSLLDYICLKNEDIVQICKRFTTVESFVAAEDEQLVTLGVSVPVEIMKLTQDELLKQMEGIHGG